MVSRPDELREALGHSDSFWDDYYDEKQDAIGVILAAARSWVEGEELLYCVPHRCAFAADKPDPDVCWAWSDWQVNTSGVDCSIVSARICPRVPNA